MSSSRYVEPWHKPLEGANPKSSSPPPSPKLDCRSTSQRPGVPSEGLERHYNQVCLPQPAPPPEVLGLRTIIKNFRKKRILIMNKTMKLGGPLSLVQERQRSPAILRQVSQRGPARTMCQKPAQLNGGTMPPKSFHKQFIFTRPNNKGTNGLASHKRRRSVQKATRAPRIGHVGQLQRTWLLTDDDVASMEPSSTHSQRAGEV